MDSYISNPSNANGPIGAWDTSDITDMYQVFLGMNLHGPIGSWDVSKGTSRANLFMGSPSPSGKR